MKYVLLLSVLLTTQLFVNAQLAHDLIKEGVALHDKGDYAAAIIKYDAALAAEPDNETALEEKASTLIAMQKYDDAEDILKKLLKKSTNSDIRRMSYVSYGTLLDQQGNGKKSLKIYEQGIKEFPNSYLLYFNKGVTEAGLNDMDDAVLSFEMALKNNPAHASSHNALARLTVNKSRIAAVLAIVSFLIIEPEGRRAQENVILLNKLLNKGISRKDDKTINITINADMLDEKKKPKEDDFTSAELLMSLVLANTNIPDSLGIKTDADKLSYQLQLLIDQIDNTEKQEKGFFKNYYVPMFVEMKKNDLVTIASYITLASSGKEEITKWLKDNKDDVDGFYRWFENYKWVKE
ncbi:MAG: tetratricopeptide repeat protein [Chitinophagaceae bacterium]